MYADKLLSIHTVMFAGYTYVSMHVQTQGPAVTVKYACIHTLTEATRYTLILYIRTQWNMTYAWPLRICTEAG